MTSRHLCHPARDVTGSRRAIPIAQERFAAQGLTILGYAALWIVGLASAGWSGTATGRILYVDRLHDYSPVGAGYVGTAPRAVRFADVEIRRADNGQVLGSGATDANGDYSFSVTSSGIVDLDLFVIANSTTSPWTDVQVRDSGRSQRVQAVASGPYRRDTDGLFGLDYTVPTDNGSVRLGGMFNIIDVILVGAEFVSSRVGMRAPACVVYWEDGSAMGTYYVIGSNRIYLRGGTPGDPDAGDDDSYDDPVILHEYGHYITDLYSYISPSAGGDHSIRSYYPPPLTWSEGWASAFQAFARDSSLYWDTLAGATAGFNIDYEPGAFNQVPAPQFRGMNNEGAVTCVLYDLYDSAFSGDTSPGQDDEAFAYGVDPIWQVVELDFAPGVLATMDDFYQGWRDRFPDRAVDAAFATFGMEFVPMEPQEFVYSRVDLGREIPDGASQGLTDTLVVSASPGGILMPGGVRVWVAIEHPYPQDLVIRLQHPDGTPALLRAPGTRDSNNPLDVTEWYGYPRYAPPAESLTAFAGKSPAGAWLLEVSDGSPGSSGILQDWRLKLRMGEQWATTPQVWLLDGLGGVHRLVAPTPTP